MTQEQIERLQVRQAAQDILLRTVFARQIVDFAPDDPRASLFRIIEGITASLHEIETPENEQELKYLHDIEAEIRRFGEQLDTRLVGMGHEL